MSLNRRPERNRLPSNLLRAINNLGIRSSTRNEASRTLSSDYGLPPSYSSHTFDPSSPGRISHPRPIHASDLNPAPHLPINSMHHSIPEFQEAINHTPPPTYQSDHRLLTTSLIEAFGLPNQTSFNSNGKIVINSDQEFHLCIRQMFAPSEAYNGCYPFDESTDDLSQSNSSLRSHTSRSAHSGQQPAVAPTRSESPSSSDYSDDSQQTTSTRSLTNSESNMLNAIGYDAYSEYLARIRSNIPSNYGHPSPTPILVGMPTNPYSGRRITRENQEGYIPSTRHSYGVRIRSLAHSTASSYY